MKYTNNPMDYVDFDALIFDMDGTLIDSGQLHENAWVETLKKHQLPSDKHLMRSLAGIPTQKTLMIICERFSISPPENINDIAQYKESLSRKYIEHFAKPTQLADIARFFNGIKPMAVGTGAHTSEAEHIISHCGLRELMDIIVGADKVQKPKPAPDTFLLCAEKLHVEPKKCVVFEDSPMGLQAAREAGMTAINVAEQLNIHNNYFL